METSRFVTTWTNDNQNNENMTLYQKYNFFVRVNGILNIRQFMENTSNLIISENSTSIPEQRNHNIIFMLLQLLFTLPLSIIISALLYSIHKKNFQIISNLNSLTMTDIKQVEKKYRRYFTFRSKHLLNQCNQLTFL